MRSILAGIGLAYDDLDTDKPEGFEAGPTENPEDENMDMDPDETLQWLNPPRSTNGGSLTGSSSRTGRGISVASR